MCNTTPVPTAAVATAATPAASNGDGAESATAKTAAPVVEVFRKDYKPLDYVVSTVKMDFHIFNGKTVVTSELTIVPNPKLSVESGPSADGASSSSSSPSSLVLDGDETSVKLLRVVNLTNKAEPVELAEGKDKDYLLEPGKLTLQNLPFNKETKTSVVQTVVEIVPEENTKLAGLYADNATSATKKKASDDGESAGAGAGAGGTDTKPPLYCTQCEAMGFRRITYFPDRPDNMSVFESVRLEADVETCPVLLSNGNLIDSGTVTGDSGTPRHYAVWSDPFPKPSYLFCCVAGTLEYIEDEFVTRSGRTVALKIYSEAHNIAKLHFAMGALKRAMKWDEDRYGREYDLDLYNIVAVESFNMGAMENKGLNVFNTSCVCADQQTATDDNFIVVERVIGHEYFHNWTGNRVTCRDWFQLTLKEGLTVFRDEEFTADMTKSEAVTRIEKVRQLRGRQFNEDAGPMSHPIRPESYISMDNFYTNTVYRKGAAVIRMYQTLLDVSGFRKGMDLYFERHDGDAVTCDDFLAAMADANDFDLKQFALWYCTNGTPTVTYHHKFAKATGTFTLTLTQESKSTNGPLHIPVSVGLLDKETGKEVAPTKVLSLVENTQSFDFGGLTGCSDVVPSILRNFSAPVKLIRDKSAMEEQSNDDGGELEALAFLAAHDTDSFNKWEAGQKLFTAAIFEIMNSNETTKAEPTKTYKFVQEAFGRTLKSVAGDDQGQTHDYSFVAYALMTPTESTLAEHLDIVDPIAIYNSRNTLKKALARDFQSDLQSQYDALTKSMAGESFKVDALSMGRRRLRNVCLNYLCSIRNTEEELEAAATLAMNHFKLATGMTDKAAAFFILAGMEDKKGSSSTVASDAREQAIKMFYEQANGDALVINKWFGIQAMAASSLSNPLDRIRELQNHPDFTLRNPNRCRSLISSFAAGNTVGFHDPSGAGYTFLGSVIAQIDKINPQVASGLTAMSMIQWKKYNPERGTLIKAELEKLQTNKDSLSKDLFEIVTRGLK